MDKLTWKYTKPKARYIASNGYVLIYRPKHPNAMANGCIYEHRLIMEGQLGRILEDDEVIHHINGNRRDNGIENLELTTMADNLRRSAILYDKAATMRKYRWKGKDN